MKIYSILTPVAMALAVAIVPAAIADPYLADTMRIQVDGGELQRRNTWRGHGDAFDEFLGTKAYANQRNGYFQCTELVHRFMRDQFGVPTKVGNGLGHARDLVQNLFRRFGHRIWNYRNNPVRMRLHFNGRATEPPAVGSAVNFASGTFGHVAIVRFVEHLSARQVRIHLLEQHGFPNWRPGEPKPIRRIDFWRGDGDGGAWVGAGAPGIGRPIAWINYFKADKPGR